MSKHLLAGAVAAVSIFGVAQSASANIIIDDFDLIPNASQLLQIDSLAPPTQTVGSVVSTPNVIGGERDLFIEKTSGNAGQRIRGRVNAAGLDLFRVIIDNALGLVSMTWDGADGDPARTAIDYDGLGSVNFAKQDFLELVTTFSNVGGPVSVTFWDANDVTGMTFATTTFDIPGGIPVGSFVSLTKEMSVVDFTVVGGTFFSIMNSVGAIQMVLDASAEPQRGWDSHFEVLQTIDVAEPAPLALLGLGIAGLAYARTRKSN